MSEDVARLIFLSIMVVGGLVWLISLFLTLRMGRVWEPTELSDLRMPIEATATPAMLTGARTVRGDPEKVGKALARSLSQLNMGMFTSLFEITERTADRLALKKTGPLICNQPPGMYFSEAEFRFERLGQDMTRVSYSLAFDRLRRRLQSIALFIILGIGLPAMIIVGAIMWLYVLPSPNPAIQWQSIQTIHIFHALWPPFLMIYLNSIGQRYSKTWVTNLLSTLDLAD